MTNLQYGDRIGTPYQESSLLYCRADNTYTDHPITLCARACRLEWAPIRQPAEPADLDLFAEMFGEVDLQFCRWQDDVLIAA